MTSANRYPALLNAGLTPIYDLFARLFLPGRRSRGELIAGACLSSGMRVLDLGAGTGTLGINFQARKPNNMKEWADAFSDLVCQTG